MNKFEELLLKEYCKAFDLEYNVKYLGKALRLCHLKRSRNE